jgi:nucleoside-diphosphate kinase
MWFLRSDNHLTYRGTKAMAIEQTLSIIKPDATQRNLTGKINAMFEGAGLRIVAQKRVLLTQAIAEAFYAEHKERSFFKELVDFMVSGPVVAQVLEGEGAIAKNRQVMGATNPRDAADDTIRKLFAKNVGENSVHGSDSPEAAKREISFFFAQYEIVG